MMLFRACFQSDAAARRSSFKRLGGSSRRQLPASCQPRSALCSSAENGQGMTVATTAAPSPFKAMDGGAMTSDDRVDKLKALAHAGSLDTSQTGDSDHAGSHLQVAITTHTSVSKPMGPRLSRRRSAPAQAPITTCRFSTPSPRFHHQLSDTLQRQGATTDFTCGVRQHFVYLTSCPGADMVNPVLASRWAALGKCTAPL